MTEISFKELRNLAGFPTQISLARFFELTKQPVMEWENGIRNPPKSVTMILHYLANGNDRELLLQRFVIKIETK